MALPAATLLLLFRAGLRVTTAADRAVAQKLRDDDIVFPRNLAADFGAGPLDAGQIRFMVNTRAGLKTWLQDNGFGDILAGLPEPGQDPADPAVLATLNQAIEAFDDATIQVSSPEAAQAHVLSQWLEGSDDRPPAPAARFALALADVAAEFVALNPTLVASGGPAELLVESFAGRIAQLLPDDQNFGSRKRLGGRLLGVILRAGLESAVQHSDQISSEQQHRDLIDAFATPLIDEFDKITDITGEIRWKAIIDTVAGPSAQAVFRVVADNQTAFFGNSFADGTLLGALNRQLVLTVAERGLRDVFTPAGTVALYQAALQVVVEQPALVISGDGAREGFARDLIAGFAAVLQASPVIGEGETEDLGLALALAALGAFQGHADALLGLDDEPLEQVASKALAQVLEGLEAGLGGADPLKSVFGRAALAQLVETILTEAASHPELIGDSSELQVIVTALGHAIGANEGRLSTQDWRQLAGVVLQQAAQNPGRLFGIDGAEPQDELVVRAISMVLAEAAKALNSDPAQGGALTGQTLLAVLESTVIAFAAHPANAEILMQDGPNGVLLAKLMEQVGQAMANKGATGQFRFGAAQWPVIYGALLTRLLVETDAEFGLVDANGKITADGEALIAEILLAA